MDKETKKELNILAILLLLLTVASVIVTILYSSWLNRIEKKIDEPLICVPIIKEDYYGDVYTLHCVRESVFEEAIKEEKAIERVL